jgi:hypothetical protein
MSAHDKWKRQCRNWLNGQGGDETILKHTAAYLAETADWIEVRNFLITMAMTKQQCLEWFADQDFGDFAEAIDDGWGWPKELEEL